MTPYTTANGQARPDWAQDAREWDLTDNWQDETDPENVLGEICTGHFETTSFGTHILSGLEVEDATGTMFFNRERAIACLGFREVSRIEDALDRLD